jgi:hypothetical protein
MARQFLFWDLLTFSSPRNTKKSEKFRHSPPSTGQSTAKQHMQLLKHMEQNGLWIIHIKTSFLNWPYSDAKEWLNISNLFTIFHNYENLPQFFIPKCLHSFDLTYKVTDWTIGFALFWSFKLEIGKLKSWKEFLYCVNCSWAVQNRLHHAHFNLYKCPFNLHPIFSFEKMGAFTTLKKIG